YLRSARRGAEARRRRRSWTGLLITRGGEQMDQVLSGGCLCGEVRYRITATPVEALYCHCRMCQRAHGAPVIAWLTVPLAAFHGSAGPPPASRSPPRAFGLFCRACGTPLPGRAPATPQHVDVSIATLDDPEPIEPLLHLWTESQIGWFEIADHLPRYPTNQRPRPVF